MTTLRSLGVLGVLTALTLGAAAPALADGYHEGYGYGYGYERGEPRGRWNRFEEREHERMREWRRHDFDRRFRDGDCGPGYGYRRYPVVPAPRSHRYWR